MPIRKTQAEIKRVKPNWPSLSPFASVYAESKNSHYRGGHRKAPVEDCGSEPIDSQIA